jgi:hypothetical protein
VEWVSAGAAFLAAKEEPALCTVPLLVAEKQLKLRGVFMGVF